MKYYVDSSWKGMGGIGRFYNEIIKRLDGIVTLPSLEKPTSFYSAISYSRLISKLEKESVIFFPGYIPPMFCKCKYIFTIHDLNHVDRLENSGFLKRVFYKIFIMRGCHKASAILTVSEFSKKRIIDWAQVDPSKVHNVGNGVDGVFNVNVSPFIANFKYLLCVSNRKLHKNEQALIKAFASSSIDKQIKLLFTGNSTSEIMMLVNSMGLKDRVIFHGFIEDKNLPSLYRGALGLVFPSLYEGFGLPVVEAMACGTPVLTSNTTSLPEVAGDAAILVNPESVDEIKIGIEKLVLDQALREDLIAKGFEQAKLFNWDDVAARVQAVLDKVAERHEK